MSFSNQTAEYAFVQASITVGVPAQLALKHIRAGEIDRALGILSLAAEQDPENAKLQELLGILQYEYGDAFKGLAHLERATNLASSNESSWCNAAHVLRRMGEQERALEFYQQAIALAPAYAEPYSGMGNIHFEEAGWERAFELYAQAITLDPQNSSYYNNRAVAALKLGMVGQALLDAQQACALSAVGLHQINFADAYVAARQVTAALQTLAQVNEEGRDSSYFTVLGKIHTQSGELSAAIQSFRKAIELNTYNLDAYEECAAAYYAVGDAMSAQYCIRQCLDMKMDSLRYRYLDCLYAIPIREASRQAGKDAQSKFIHKVDRLQNWLSMNPQPLAALIGINFVSPLYFLYSSECSELALLKYQELQALRAPTQALISSAVADAICIVTAKTNDADYADLCLNPLLRELVSKGTAIHLLSIGIELGAENLGEAAAYAVHDLTTALETIEGIRPKALIYTDAGSNYLSYALAGLRLAPLQLQTWNAGCCLFTDTLDGLLVPDFFVGMDCTDVPIEKMVTYRHPLDGLVASNTVSEPTIATAASGANLLLCDASSLKYQGEYIELLLGLLQKNPELRVRLASDFGYSSLNLKNDLLARAGNWDVDVAERVEFVAGGLAGLLGSAPAGRAFVMDAFPYSDFTTTQAALALDIPVVAMRGLELHGQTSAQLLAALDLAPMLVAENSAEYAELGQRLIGDGAFYAQACANIKAAKNRLAVARVADSDQVLSLAQLLERL